MVTIPLEEYEELKRLKEMVDSKAIIARYEGYRSTSYYPVAQDQLFAQIGAATLIASDRYEKANEARDKIIRWLNLPLYKRLFTKL